MYVRLANDWTGPDDARHHAGDLIEVDNVTLAELEAGGFVSTEDTPKRPEQEHEHKSEEDKKQPTGFETDKESGDTSSGVEPEQTGWPGVS
ncbi:hypothetical protein [Actinocatenispora rupis]|uniref:hypothetical protein n=1 Tax=Actinocatenispora rupis TaxID=519421 RepID=UPI001941262F|nr:hypothetical protein [Actinocatenispora rupis]